MTSDEAYAICEREGVMDDVRATPPAVTLPPEAIDFLRRTGFRSAKREPLLRGAS